MIKILAMYYAQVKQCDMTCWYRSIISCLELVKI